jgi:hypothetical protein
MSQVATAAGNSGTNQNLWAVIRSALQIVEQRGLSTLTNGKATSMKDFDKNKYVMPLNFFICVVNLILFRCCAYDVKKATKDLRDRIEKIQ